MSQHFLLSAAARSLSLAQVMRLSDAEVETVFAGIRWASTGGDVVCPECGGCICYECRRPNGALRYRCKACRGDFSITSGTLFAHHKMPLRVYLAAIVIFCNEVKGKSALALSRDLGVQYKTAFALAHKLREATATEMHGRRVGGNGKAVEIDGAYFGGYIKPANIKEHRRDRRFAVNQNSKRQCVVIARERDGHIVPAVFKSESDALGFIRRRVAKGTTIHADEANACARSTTNRLTAWPMPAPTRPSRSSRAFAGASWGTITTSPAHISDGTPKKAHGVKIIAGPLTATMSGLLRVW
jgi:transposase-like protein